MPLRGEFHELVSLPGVLLRPERGGPGAGVRLGDGRRRGHRRPGAGGDRGGHDEWGARRESAGTANAEAGRSLGGARPAVSAGGGGEARRRRGDTDDAGHGAVGRSRLSWVWTTPRSPTSTSTISK